MKAIVKLFADIVTDVILQSIVVASVAHLILLQRRELKLPLNIYQLLQILIHRHFGLL
jgi:hypothetical protein